jgi:hypothetical protein
LAARQANDGPASSRHHPEQKGNQLMEQNSNVGGVVALFSGVFGLVFAALVFVFWLWMLIDCIKNETDGTQRIIWALVVFFFPCIGSLIYLFARKMQRGKA